MEKNETIDRELIFQILNSKEWLRLVEILKNNEYYEFIINEPILRPIVNQYLIEELLNNSSLEGTPTFKHILLEFYKLHISNRYKFEFSKIDFEKLIEKIIKEEKDLTIAYNYALKCSENLLCKKTIEKFKKNLPKKVKHSQESYFSVSSNKNIRKEDCSRSLFKSHQEFLFFKAVRELFPMYLVLPNVSANAVIEFDLIEGLLNPEEKKYFFMMLIDCVVIDTENKYKPINFIELDGPHHEYDEEQKKKDIIKDKILSIAGQKLIRIKPKIIVSSESDFIPLIRETIKTANNKYKKNNGSR